MGNESSLPMEMCSNCNAFDAEEIKRLARRFKKLDLDGSGSLSIDEFMSLPELQQNPLVQRVIDIFDTDGNGEVDFKEFIQGISQFSVKGDKETKLRFAFKIYDMDRDGYISNGELFQVLKMMVGNNLKTLNYSKSSTRPFSFTIKIWTDEFLSKNFAKSWRTWTFTRRWSSIRDLHAANSRTLNRLALRRKSFLVVFSF